MTAVTTTDGIKYGFKLIGYQMLVTLIGGGIAFVGFFLTSAFGIAAVDNGSTEGGLFALLIGGVFLLAGAAVWLAGMAGTTYKVVADAVEAGTLSASTGSGRAATSAAPQQASGREARTGRSGGQTRGSSSRPSGDSKAGSRSPSNSGSRPESRSGSKSGSSTETERRDSSGGRSRSSGSRSKSSGNRSDSRSSRGSRDGSSGDGKRSSRGDTTRRRDDE
ncbi:hypothetical protein [Haloarchaeobius sp. FL176]|uniref:hypothetical protein n=1 Tax=Haloarchaeobius sp. FL176 TaxID=2967129 RepID=UPI002147E14C|nr:hypothetical protein [Haloarchaeobius sp. FL176]